MLWAGSNGSVKEGEGSGARRRPTVVAPDAAETPMSVASAAAEPYVPTPASTVRSTDKENDTSWANGRPNHWLSDHRNPMYGQVCMLLPSVSRPGLGGKTCAAAAVPFGEQGSTDTAGSQATLLSPMHKEEADMHMMVSVMKRNHRLLAGGCELSVQVGSRLLAGELRAVTAEHGWHRQSRAACPGPRGAPV